MSDLDQIAEIAVKDFMLIQQLSWRRRCKLLRIIKAALEKALEEGWQQGWDDAIRACKPAAAAKWLAQDRAAQASEHYPYGMPDESERVEQEGGE